ncbi:NAD(P)-dependent oxidoreductase [Humitalea sp. 24SJ18S-53]|uniref:NAD(P)-dependent oxidoreductase n=1 Tax=Humitalea sp. 24SJ18S-53 TaxID=3422307 RepID=UPI003D66CC3C
MRLAIINDYQNLALAAADWPSLPGGIVPKVHGRLSGPDEAAAVLAGCEIVVTAREETRFDAALIARLPDLRLVVTHGMNNAALDLAALAAAGVTVCGTTYGFSAATAELAWGLILGLVKNIPAEDRTIRAGGWGADLGRGLTGRVLGVLGLGDLGGRVARVGAALGMEVIAWSPRLTDAAAAEAGARRVTREALFAEADVLTIHVRYSPALRGMIGAAEIAAMKPGAILINTARGPIVDEAALVAALRSGALGGAGLDVFDQEPLPPGHPLTLLPNTLLTSHIGGRTRENFLARYQGSFEAVRAWLAGQPVRVLS